MKKTNKEVKKKTNFIQQAVKSRGFYIAAASLAVIIGFTVYARQMRSELQEEVASFDDAAWKEAVEDSGYQIVNVDSTVDKPPVESKQPTITETAEEKSVETAVPTSATPEKRTEVPKFTIQMPCTGAVVAECSVDELVYCDTMDDWRTHNGIDIAAALGNQVKAAATGVVSKVYKDDLLGVVVVLDHGNGISSLYGNLQSADFIKTGTEVKAGDIIGGIGEPGALEAKAEPHLHFELIENGEYKNPKEYLQ